MVIVIVSWVFGRGLTGSWRDSKTHFVKSSSSAGAVGGAGGGAGEGAGGRAGGRAVEGPKGGGGEVGGAGGVTGACQ